VVLGAGSCGDKKPSDETRPPACSLAVTYVDFGNVVIGDARTMPVVVSNIGGRTLRATLRSPCAEFAVEGDSILDVAAGRSASFRVTFAPSAEGGHSCVLAEAIGGCGDVTCAGFGAATACAVIPDRLDFGPVPVFATADRIVTIRNAGRTTLSGVIYSPCPDFAVSPTAYDIPAGGSATVIVRFAPIVGGTSTCRLQIGHPACADVSCSGEGSWLATEASVP
jgi:hypothetical protein